MVFLVLMRRDKCAMMPMPPQTSFQTVGTQGSQCPIDKLMLRAVRNKVSGVAE